MGRLGSGIRLSAIRVFLKNFPTSWVGQFQIFVAGGNVIGWAGNCPVEEMFGEYVGGGMSCTLTCSSIAEVRRHCR